MLRPVIRIIWDQIYNVDPISNIGSTAPKSLNMICIWWGSVETT